MQLQLVIEKQNDKHNKKGEFVKIHPFYYKL